MFRPTDLAPQTHRPILFLDFDGVLHPNWVYCEEGRPVIKEDPIDGTLGELFMWVHHLDAALKDYPEVRIILSTSWVKGYGFERTKAYLPESLQVRVIGGTWDPSFNKREYDKKTRCQEIVACVVRERLERWCAVDDDVWDWSPKYKEHLVATDSRKGLGDPAALARLGELLTAMVV